jgi:TonB-dependent receptor
MRRYLKSICLSLLWIALCADAQERKGIITGLITDSAHAILQGASVELQQVGKKTASDNTGQFSITDVAPGTYTLNISFVGMAPYSKEITVTGGQATRVEAQMEIASASDSVTVTADRVHGEAEAINRERTAENILQVLPAEIITSLPNANVADAIGRLPSVTLERDEGEGKYVQIRGTEPRYSNVTIDGVNVPSPESGVRQIKLDTIGSDLVESVEINKTLLANMDGDGIGGSVNLRTKTAGDQPALSLYGIGGYTPIQNGRTADQFGGTVSQRFGKDKRLGILFGGTYDWNGRGIDDVEPNPTVINCLPGDCSSAAAASPNSAPFGTVNNESIRLYTYYRSRYGFSGAVDYKLGDNSSIYVRGLYSHFDNYGDVWALGPNINSYTTSATQGGPDGSMSYYTSIRRPIDVIGSMVAGGQHYFQTSWFSWDISASRSSEDQHGYSTANFAPGPNSPLNSVQFALDRSDPYRPKFVVQNGVNIYDPTQYLLQQFDVDESYSPQVNLQASANYVKQYNWAGHSGSLEIGGKIRNAHKFSEPDDVVYNLSNPAAVPLSLFPLKQTVNNFYNGSYKTGAAINYSSLMSFYHANSSLFTVDPIATLQNNAGGLYNLVERIGAGYIMNTISFGRFRLNTGVRFETTTENVYGTVLSADDQGNFTGLSSVKRNYTNVDVLPSAELRIGLASDSALRLSYGRGIARPNFGDLAPNISLSISSVNGGRNTSSAGNPDLKPTHADNYDILFEQYLKPLGLFTAGLFYKNIQDPIVYVETNGVHYPGYTESFLQTAPINAGSAYVWGWEAAYEQRWSFLPGLLGGLGFSGNYSFTSSSTDGLPGRSDHPPLLRQAPNTWNLSPTYDRGRLSVRMGLSYNQANIFAYQYQDGAALGKTGPLGDNYLYTHLQVDAQGSYRLPKGFKLIVYGLNLTNEVFGFYNGSVIWPVQREYYHATIGAGVRWSSLER